MARARLLALVFMCLVSASVNSACPQSGGPGATAPATQQARSGDSRAASPQLRVKWQAGKLSLDVAGALLSEVLQAIARETGIEIEGAEGLSDPVFAHFTGMDLAQVLQQLLSHMDYAIAAAPTGLTPSRETRVIILKRPAPDSLGAASVAKTQTNATVPDAGVAIQVAATTSAESDPEASNLTTTLAAAEAGNPPAAEQTHQVQTEQQNGTTAVPDDGLKNTDPSVSANAVQQATENMNAAAMDASNEAPPSAEPLPDAVQAEKLVAVEAAATGQDREALAKYMQDSNAAVQAAAFDALAAHDNPAAVESLLAEINDVGQPSRLQALQLLSQSPQADEQIVMTTLIDALNSADPSLSSYAAQALAARGTPDAMNALNEMLNTSDTSTRLAILQSVAQTEAGLPLLRAALSDPDESVRNAAGALLQLATTKKP